MGEYKATRVFIPGQILPFFTYFFVLFHCYFIGGLQFFLVELWDQILPFFRNWIYNFAGSRDDSLKKCKNQWSHIFSTVWKFSNYFGRTPQRYETLQTPDVELKAASEVKTSAAIRSTTEHQKSAI